MYFLQHMVGRRRNCYSIAIRNVHRSLQYTTKHRAIKKQEMRNVSVICTSISSSPKNPSNWLCFSVVGHAYFGWRWTIRHFAAIIQRIAQKRQHHVEQVSEFHNFCGSCNIIWFNDIDFCLFDFYFSTGNHWPTYPFGSRRHSNLSSELHANERKWTHCMVYKRLRQIMQWNFMI